MNGDNVIKVSKIRRDGFTEYRIDVRSSFTTPGFRTYIPDEYIAAILANQIREFVNASVLGECIEVEYKKTRRQFDVPYLWLEGGGRMSAREHINMEMMRSSGVKSNYDKLFGTPERAARTLEEFELDQLNWCRGTEYCESCPYEFDRYGCYPPDGFSLIEWLMGDA